MVIKVKNDKLADSQLFKKIRQKLFTAVVGDILDKMGFTQQFLPQPIKPINSKMVIVGRAMTVLEADHQSEFGQNPASNQPFGLMFPALDSLSENEVYIANGSSFSYALWGGLMSTRAIHCKAAGAVLNGFHRDTNEILQLNFPVFSRGSYAQDQGVRGKVLDYRLPIYIEGVKVSPGDLIFADGEGVLVIPKITEKEAIAQALEKVATENKVRIAISEGMDTVTAFNKFGVM